MPTNTTEEGSGTAVDAEADDVAPDAVRGVRPITRLDESPVGDDRPRPWAARFAAALVEG